MLVIFKGTHLNKIQKVFFSITNYLKNLSNMQHIIKLLAIAILFESFFLISIVHIIQILATVTQF